VRSGVRLTVALALAVMFAVCSGLFALSDWVRDQPGVVALVGGILLALAGMGAIAFVLCYAIGSLLPGALEARHADEPAPPAERRVGDFEAPVPSPTDSDEA
jgi:hypothetical protein